ncbi:CoA transferase [Bradyrhizobium sp. 87]|uniref:CoA transferase n=1 Tax=Bradyrhizobium sp. 87 TaxID=2782682 RepID=UPI001FF7655F|nr:CoA transferase [Bradyrhizobium sp. 87]MCK1425801.1 CoA transferase [Bradyrhizobium sp. 87]
MMLVVGNDSQFAGHAPLSRHLNSLPIQNFLKNNDRVANGKEIMASFADLLSKNTVAHWLHELEKTGVPCGPVKTFTR